jgi:stage II sporulation protein D
MRQRKFLLGLIAALLIILSIVYVPGHLQKDHATPEPEIKLFLSKKNQVLNLKLEEYLVGTLAAEMPASFDLEALKAQAVCARTYAVRKIVKGQTYPMGADLSDDITCCQAYCIEADYNKIDPRWQKKLEQAVQETRGEIMLYQDEPIDALYHSTCGGRTESAEDAWINGCPYLRSISCRYCNYSPHFSSQHSFDENFVVQQLAARKTKTVSLRILERSASGRVKSLAINGQKISGDKFRRALNLPSTCFTLTKQKKKLIITCQGYGHGVGMCQYGANGMARAGRDYEQILKTYYHGIDIYKMQY